MFLLSVRIAACVKPIAYAAGINAMKGVVVYLWTILHSLLHFVVEGAFVARTHDAEVFLAGALEEGMNGGSVMDIEATGLKWVPGRNGFVRRGGIEGRG